MRKNDAGLAQPRFVHENSGESMSLQLTFVLIFGAVAGGCADEVELRELHFSVGVYPVARPGEHDVFLRVADWKKITFSQDPPDQSEQQIFHLD